MSKIGYSGSKKLKGNIERVLEMSPELGDNAISGVFKDDGIEISPQFVREIRLGAVLLSKKALPKLSAKKAIAAVKKDKKTSTIPSNGALN